MSGKSSNGNDQESAKVILREFIDVSCVYKSGRDALTTRRQQSPASQYTFDSERGADRSQICRRRKDQTECIQVWLSSKQLFEAMQVCPPQSVMWGTVLTTSLAKRLFLCAAHGPRKDTHGLYTHTQIIVQIQRNSTCR